MGKQNFAGRDPIGDEAGIGTTREGGRGMSQDSIQVGSGEFATKNPAGATFFGSQDGKNEDTLNKPEIKAPTKPTL